MTNSCRSMPLVLSQCSPRPARYGRSMRFDTMPSRPSRQACSNIVGPSCARCSLKRIGEPSGRPPTICCSSALRSISVAWVRSNPRNRADRTRSSESGRFVRAPGPPAAGRSSGSRRCPRPRSRRRSARSSDRGLQRRGNAREPGVQSSPLRVSSRTLRPSMRACMR